MRRILIGGLLIAGLLAGAAALPRLTFDADPLYSGDSKNARTSFSPRVRIAASPGKVPAIIAGARTPGSS